MEEELNQDETASQSGEETIQDEISKAMGVEATPEAIKPKKPVATPTPAAVETEAAPVNEIAQAMQKVEGGKPEPGKHILRPHQQAIMQAESERRAELPFVSPDWLINPDEGGIEKHVLGPAFRGIGKAAVGAWGIAKDLVSSGKAIDKDEDEEDLPPPQTVDIQDLQIGPKGEVDLQQLIKTNMIQANKDEILADALTRQIVDAEKAAGIPDSESKGLQLRQRIMNVAENKAHFKRGDPLFPDTEHLGTLIKSGAQLMDHIVANAPLALVGWARGTYDYVPVPEGIDFAGDRKKEIDVLDDDKEMNFNGTTVIVEPGESIESVNKKVWEKFQDQVTDTFIYATRNGFYDDLSMMSMASKLGKYASPTTVLAEQVLKAEAIVNMSKSSGKIAAAIRAMRNHPRAMAALTQATEGAFLREYPQDGMGVLDTALPAILQGAGGALHGYDFTPKSQKQARLIAQDLYSRGTAERTLSGEMEIPLIKGVPQKLIKDELVNVTRANRLKERIETKLDTSPDMLQTALDIGVDDPEIKKMIDVHLLEVAGQTPESYRNANAINFAYQNRVSKIESAYEGRTAEPGYKASMRDIQEAKREMYRRASDTKELLDYVKENHESIHTPMEEFIGRVGVNDVRRKVMVDMFNNFLNSETDDVSRQLNKRKNAGILEGVSSMELNIPAGIKTVEKLGRRAEDIKQSYRMADKGLKAILKNSGGNDEIIRTAVEINATLRDAFRTQSNFTKEQVTKKLTKLYEMKGTSEGFRGAVRRTKRVVEVWNKKQRLMDIDREKMILSSMEDSITQSQYAVKQRRLSSQSSYRPSNLVNYIFKNGNDQPDIHSNIIEHHRDLLTDKSFPAENEGKMLVNLEKISNHMTMGRAIPENLTAEYKELTDTVTGANLRKQKSDIESLIEESAMGDRPQDIKAFEDQLRMVKEELKNTAKGYTSSTTLFHKALKQYNRERSWVLDIEKSVKNVVEYGDSDSFFTALAKASHAINEFNIERFRTSAIRAMRDLSPLWNDFTENMPFSHERKYEMFMELTGGLAYKLRKIENPAEYRNVMEAHISNIKAALTHLPEGMLEGLSEMHQQIFGKEMDKEMLLAQFLVPTNAFDAWKDLQRGYLNLTRLQVSAEAKLKELNRSAYEGWWTATMGEHEMAVRTGYASVQGLATFAEDNRKGDRAIYKIWSQRVSSRHRAILNWGEDVTLALKKIDGMAGFSGFYDGHRGYEGGHYLTSKGKVIQQMFMVENENTQGIYTNNNKRGFIARHTELRRQYDADHISKLPPKERAKYYQRIVDEANKDFDYLKEFSEKDEHFWETVWSERKWFRDMDSLVFSEHVSILEKQNADQRYAQTKTYIPPKKWREQRVMNEKIRNYDIDDLSDTLYTGEDFSRSFGTSEAGQIAKANRLDDASDISHPVLTLQESSRRIIKGAYLAHSRTVLDKYRLLTKSMGYEKVDSYVKTFMAGGRDMKQFARLDNKFYHLETTLTRAAYNIAGKVPGGLATLVVIKPLTDLFLNAAALTTRLSNPLSLFYNAITAINFMLTQSGSSALRGVPKYVKAPVRVGLGVAGFSLGGIPGAAFGIAPDYVFKFFASAARIGWSFTSQVLFRKDATALSNRANLGPIINRTLAGLIDADHRNTVMAQRALLDVRPGTKMGGVGYASSWQSFWEKGKDLLTRNAKEHLELAISHMALENAATVYEAAKVLLVSGRSDSRQLAAKLIQDSLRSAPTNVVWAQVLAIDKAVKAGTPYVAAQNFMQTFHSEVIGKFGPLSAPIMINNISPLFPKMSLFYSAITQGPYKVIINSVDAARFTANRIARFESMLRKTGNTNMPLPLQGMVYASGFGLVGMMGAAYFLKNGFGQSVMEKVKLDKEREEREYWLSKLFEGHENQLAAFGYGFKDIDRAVPLAIPSEMRVPLSSRGVQDMWSSSLAYGGVAIKDWIETSSAMGYESVTKELPFLESKVNIMRSNRNALHKEGKFKEAQEIDMEIIKLQDYYSTMKWNMFGDTMFRSNVFSSWLIKDIGPLKIAYIMRNMRREYEMSEAMSASEQVGFDVLRQRESQAKEHYYPWQDLLVKFGFNKYTGPDNSFFYDKWYNDVGPALGYSKEEIDDLAAQAQAMDRSFQEWDETYDILAKSGALGRVDKSTAGKILEPIYEKPEDLDPKMFEKGDPERMKNLIDMMKIRPKKD